MKEYDEGQVSNVEVMFQIKVKRMEAKYDEVMKLSADIARHYARAKLLEYSAKHPNRTCELRVGMGSCDLHVETSYPGIVGSFIFSADHPVYHCRRDLKPPQFLVDLWLLGESLGQRNGDWFGIGVMRAHHGVMLFNNLHGDKE